MIFTWHLLSYLFITCKFGYCRPNPDWTHTPNLTNWILHIGPLYIYLHVDVWFGWWFEVAFMSLRLSASLYLTCIVALLTGSSRHDLCPPGSEHLAASSASFVQLTPTNTSPIICCDMPSDTVRLNDLSGHPLSRRVHYGNCSPEWCR